jgi:hypothetical protein
MGENNFGQLGNGTSDYSAHTVPIYVTNNVVAVAAGYGHSLFVKSDGTLWAMGLNNFGQLGNGTSDNINPPVAVASNVVAVAAGYYHSLLVKADGTLWAMGLNSNGELGNGTVTATNLPIYVTNNVVAVAAGNNHSLLVKADGTLWAMGYNPYGELGNGTMTSTNLPTLVNNGGLLAASLAKGGAAAFHCLAIAEVTPVAGALTNQTVTVGQPASFTASVSAGDGPFTYQWQLSGTNLLNATNALYTLASAALSDAGSYMVVVTSPFGSTSQSATLTVNKATPSVTTWPTATAITLGQTLASSALSGGASTPVGSFAFTTLTTAPSVGTASQNVTFTPTDTANYATTNWTASVTVNAAGTTNVVVSDSNPSLPGANVTFTATVGAVAPGSGIPTNQVCFLTNGIPATTNYLDANGLATYSTTLLPHGSDTVTAQYISDGNFLPSTNSVAQVVDTPPVAGAHYLGAITNTPLTILANALAVLDYDADGDTLSITAVSGTSTNGPSGNVTLSGGNVHYTPANGFIGDDQFTYTISDGFMGGTATSTAKVTVRLGQATSVFNSISASSGTVNLRGHGIPGRSYDIQWSANANFSPVGGVLGPVTAAANGIITYTDDAGAGPRYYRFAAVQLDN